MSGFKCANCGAREIFKVMSVKEFKEKFKVGDKLEGFSTNKSMVITAIGRDRFLYTCDSNKESVGSIYHTNAKWRKPGSRK